jgi:rod shape-determining protein MreC
MIVLDKIYLVGKIVEVNYISSRVLLLSDLNSKIPVVVNPHGILSIMSGTGKDIGVIQYSKEGSLIEDISLVYTSGSSGLFKSGIPIGKINNVNLENRDKVNFFSDFSQLSFVKIVSFKDSEKQ